MGSAALPRPKMPLHATFVTESGPDRAWKKGSSARRQLFCHCGDPTCHPCCASGRKVVICRAGLRRPVLRSTLPVPAQRVLRGPGRIAAPGTGLSLIEETKNWAEVRAPVASLAPTGLALPRLSGTPSSTTYPDRLFLGVSCLVCREYITKLLTFEVTNPSCLLFSFFLHNTSSESSCQRIVER